MSEEALSDKTQSSDADNAALMQQIERTIPPMDIADAAANGPELARRMYVEHNILIKDCAAKSMPHADRYLRIASRTPAENQHLVAVLGTLC